MACDWSEVIPDILEIIAEKSMSNNLKDFVMFSCVCRSWNQAAVSLRNFYKKLMLKHDQIPWLVLPNDLRVDDDDEDNRKLFDLGNNECYSVRLPHASKRKLYGTGSEWLLTVGLDRQIHLLNPLTQDLLPLPPYTTFAYPPTDDDVDDEEYYERCERHKAVEWLRCRNAKEINGNNEDEHYYEEEEDEVEDEDEDEDEVEDEDELEDEDEDEVEDDEVLDGFVRIVTYDDDGNETGRFLAPENPIDMNEWFRLLLISRALVVHLNDDPSKLLVVVIYGKFEYVAIAYPNEKDCRWIPIDNVIRVADVAYCSTSGLLLFQQLSGHVNACDLKQLNSNTISLSAIKYVPPPPTLVVQDGPELSDLLYLFESFGDILMVHRSYDANTKDTCKFQVYSLDLHIKEWREVLDLGDIALFVGNSPTTFVKASNFPTTCKPNSIYFNDDGLRLYDWGFDDQLGGRDMGVYNFAYKTKQSFYHSDDNLSKYSVPVWLKPRL